MAKKSFLTIGETYHRVNKKYLTVNGTYRKVKKIYKTVNGVYVLQWTSGDIWIKYEASSYYSSGYYQWDDASAGYTYTSGNYYGKPVSMGLYDDYGFSSSNGFYGISASSTGKYRVESSRVYLAEEMTVNPEKTTDTNIYLDVTWKCVASATYYSGYHVYSKGAFIDEVIAEEGQLPTAETPVRTEDDGNRIYVYEDNVLYCYEKPALAVLDEAVLNFTILS